MTEPLKIFQLTKANHNYLIYIDRVDSKGQLYPCFAKRGIPQDKIITDIKNQKFWNGSRYFATEELLQEVCRIEAEAEMKSLPSSEEVIAFWEGFCAKNHD